MNKKKWPTDTNFSMEVLSFELGFIIDLFISEIWIYKNKFNKKDENIL